MFFVVKRFIIFFDLNIGKFVMPDLLNFRLDYNWDQEYTDQHMIQLDSARYRTW